MFHNRALYRAIGRVIPILACLLAGYRIQGGRVANTTLTVPSTPPLSGYFVADAFPELKFDQPVGVATPPGETNRLFVIERPGRIIAITNLAQPTRTVFLDLTTNTYAGYLESGLLGLAFHPRFESNGFFYVFRTLLTSTEGRANLLHNQVSRFQASPADASQALADSELRLIAQYDDSVEHNGGSLQFGPDGCLYISLGDATPPPLERSSDPQAIDRGFFGGILRIDVDLRPGSLPPNPGPSSTTNYAIPPDNPFVGVVTHNGRAVDPLQVRTEFYATGLRNPWRMAFDTGTGLLYCGDVGSGDWEEIDLIEPGGNYGWPFEEGVAATGVDRPAELVTRPPLLTYGHGYAAHQGRCVVGGVVYRGSGMPGLYGAYVFGDYISGSQWAAWHEGTNLLRTDRLCGETGVAAYGVDPRDGGILLVNVDRGAVQKLEYRSPDAAPSFPATLADTGVFADLRSLTPEPGIHEYAINVPFWSDNARKRRWFSVPDPNDRIQFREEEPFLFPTGTVWIKHFELEMTTGVPESARRIETRLLVRNPTGIHGVTYRWNEGQTNATLVPDEGADENFLILDGGLVRTQSWHFPSRLECLSCHTPKAGYALGFGAAQLHRSIDGPDGPTNQIELLSGLDYFSPPVTDTSGIRPLASATNLAFPVGYRVRSYLSANCAQCHQPELPESGFRWDTRLWNARFDVPLSAAEIINGRLVSTLGSDQTRVIAPHSTDYSILFWRVNQRARDQMPPLATSLIDAGAVELLKEWINTLPLDPWAAADIGESRQEGYDNLSSDIYRVSGAGSGIRGEGDSFHFLNRPARGDIEFKARVTGVAGGPDSAQFGIMLRQELGPDEPFVMIEATPSRGPGLFFRRTAGGPVERLGVPGDNLTAPVWMRLIRSGDGISAARSADGVEWTPLGSLEVDWGEALRAGMAVASGASPRLQTATFEKLRLRGLNLALDSPSPAVAPAEVNLSVRRNGDTSQLGEVKFLANGAPIETSALPASPDQFRWRGVGSGHYTIVAVATDQDGNTVSSIPVEFDVVLPPPAVYVGDSDETTQGGWRSAYGSDGALLFDHLDNLPAYAEVNARAGVLFTWAAAVFDSRALESSVPGVGVASTLYHDNEIVLDVALTDGRLHRLALYFLDYDGNNQRKQLVEVVDAASGMVMDRQVVERFSEGRYLCWDLRGQVVIRISRQGFGNAVVSGLFLDPPQDSPPWVSLTWSSEEGTAVIPAVVEVQAEAYDPGGGIRRVEFLLNGEKFGESTEAPYTMEWLGSQPGTYSLTARAIDDRGQSTTSDPVQVVLVLPGARAEFAGVDRQTQGNWIGAYGSEGFAIANLITNLPAWLNVEWPGTDTFVWPGPTDDPPALERTDSLRRIASCWWAREGFDLEVALRDGADHRLSLYLLDYAGGDGRIMRIEVLDAADDAVLDSREVGTFSQGAYYSWMVRGQVRVRITRLTSNAVVSGLFVDSPTVSLLPPWLIGRELAGDQGAFFELRLLGQPNYPYLIEASTDLLNWVPWNVGLVGADGEVTLRDADASASPSRFFRAVHHR